MKFYWNKWILATFIGIFLFIHQVHSLNLEFSVENEIHPRQSPFLTWLTGVIGLRPTIPTTTFRPVLPPYTTTAGPALNKCGTECACGIPNKKRRIVGGHETQVNQYPWVAMLIYSGKFYCGATLINDRYVMTAAHCVSGFNPRNIIVRFLDHNKSSPHPDRIDRKLKTVIIHAKYNASNYDNDIALLQLDKPLEFNSSLRPVCLPDMRKSFTGEIGKVTGWGATREHGAPSDTLQEVNVPILSNSECKRTNYKPERISDNMICAGNKYGEKDSCQGDSGGPMHVVKNEIEHQIVGVVSWGEGCAQPNFPGVYTRVNRFLTWTKSNTLDACYC